MPESDDPMLDALRAHADLGLDPSRQHEIVDAFGRDAPKRGHARWRRRPALTFAVVLTVSAATAATAATGLWSPVLGDDQRGHPTTAVDDVPADQLQRFGVLRRAAAEVDRDAETRSALAYLDPSLEGVRVQRIRTIQGLPGSGRYLLIPAALANGKVRDALCLYALDAHGGGMSCWSTQQIVDGEAVIYAIRRANPSTNAPAVAKVTGLVPDGVQTVQASTGARADVHDNAFALTTELPRGASLTWLDRDGTTRKVAPLG